MHAHITIDGNTAINADLGTANTPTPPPELLKHFQTHDGKVIPPNQQQPGILALLVAFGNAARAHQDFTANLETRANGSYTLTVEAPTIEAPHQIASLNQWVDPNTYEQAWPTQ